mgnify:CR=1 FL=1|jgi:hypothetical protein
MTTRARSSLAIVLERRRRGPCSRESLALLAARVYRSKEREYACPRPDRREYMTKQFSSFTAASNVRASLLSGRGRRDPLPTREARSCSEVPQALEVMYEADVRIQFMYLSIEDELRRCTLKVALLRHISRSPRNARKLCRLKLHMILPGITELANGASRADLRENLPRTPVPREALRCAWVLCPANG